MASLVKNLARAPRLHSSRPLHVRFNSTNASKAIADAAANRRKQWIVLIPDKPGALETRLEVRKRHLEAIAPHVDRGLFKVAGGFLDSHPNEQDPKLKINGSILLAQAETKEEVIEVLKRDIYTTSGVWDWDRFEIRPFKAAYIVP